MSTKHVRDASDLWRFRCGLKIECQDCQYAVSLDAQEVIKGIGMLALSELQGRLKCTRCGAKNARIVILTPPERR